MDPVPKFKSNIVCNGSHITDSIPSHVYPSGFTFGLKQYMARLIIVDISYPYSLQVFRNSDDSFVGVNLILSGDGLSFGRNWSKSCFGILSNDSFIIDYV